MIKRVELELFKCFSLLRLPLEPLTLLSGANATGKSTVLQALVLLHQTIVDHEWSRRLQLNGSEIQLGTVTDVVDKLHGRREFSIAIVDGEQTVKWAFIYRRNKEAMSAAVKSVTVNGQAFGRRKKLRFLLPVPLRTMKDLARRLRTLTYLTAERVGPRDAYPIQDPDATQVVGPCGENAVGLLYQQRGSDVLPSLSLKPAPPNLLAQVETRMKAFFPGTSLNVQHVPQTNFVVLGLRTSDATNFHRPIHVGFGLTQVLPIIVAALAAKKGDLLLIENPEVHLHPAGQSLMGQFLAELAAAGVQVIVESHSDHVLNGIRRAVKGKKIASENVALHFFQSCDEEGEQVITPTLDSSGNIDRWPKGFFDQFDKDVNHFAGWGE